MKTTIHMIIGLAAVLAVTSISATATAGDLSDALEGSDEEFLVFPTYAAMQDDGSLVIPIRAWVFEPEEDSLKRKVLIEMLEEAIDVEEPADEEIFEERIQPFVYDNERGKDVVAVIGSERYPLGESAANGHLVKTLTLPAAKAMHAIVASPGRRTLEVRVEAVDQTLEIEVPVIGRRGFSVISDIDDTLKDSNVLDRRALIRNTFMKPFAQIPGMSQAYQRMAQTLGARFHYLSASPWQLYPFLEPWMDEEGFPHGTYHLRQLRPGNPTSLKRFVGDSGPHKIASIEQLLEHMPEREFILIGDSGEADPEVYGDIARRHPDRISRILIRRVDGAENGQQRFEEAFKDVPTTIWRVFEDPATLTKPL